jgi:hypothetical protein
MVKLVNFFVVFITFKNNDGNELQTLEIRKKRFALLPIWNFFLPVLGLELRAFTLSHSTTPIFMKGFLRYSLTELFVWAGFEP